MEQQLAYITGLYFSSFGKYAESKGKLNSGSEGAVITSPIFKANVSL